MSEEVSEWLDRLGLGEYTTVFANNDIDAGLIPQLTNEDLKELGVESLGHRKIILNAAEALKVSRSGLEPAAPGPAPSATPEIPTAEAERRQLTVMFCDLVGSTELSQQLDPEDLRQLVTSYQSACNTAIARFDGYVARYMGDGLLVYFGYPTAHEDDAERAVRAGLEVVASVASLDSPYDVELKVRVGIATGTVVVGDIVGQGASEERAVLGETPNLAARLQGIAPPAGVVIADATRRLVEGRVEMESLGALSLKGFSKPVEVYRATSLRSTSRFEAATAGGLTSFVGRDSEVNLLAERWRQARAGEGQVVLLSGEAGIGKSRVLSELCEQLGEEPHGEIRYQCSPYGANIAFLPVIEQLRNAAGFGGNDTDNDRLDKLELLLRDLPHGSGSAPALLAGLVSLPVERYPPLDMSPVKQKLDTIALLVERMEQATRDNPLLVLVEDVHWIDPSTLEVFDAFVERAQDLPMLMVITHRPEFEQHWGEFGHVTHHSLNRLSRQDGRVLATRVAGGRELPENVLERVLESTDGVPLFVEELVKTVLESGVVREVDGRLEAERVLPHMAIPTTLKDSLMARLDRLSPMKEVAQAAACIGREFSSTLLAAVVGANDLDRKLEQLVSAGLIFRRGSGDRGQYIFKHALVQDAAHDSLLVSRRRQLHARIAEAISASSEPAPAVLAHHYSIAGVHDRAAENYLEAGRRSLVLSALAEAVRELELGLKQVEAVEPGETRDTLELDTRIALGAARMALLGWPHDSVSDALVRAFELAQAQHRRKTYGPILWGLCVHYWTRSEFEPTLYWLDKLEVLADQAQDAELSAVRDMTAGCQYFWQAEYARARRYTVHIRQTYDETANSHIAAYTNHDPLVFSLIWAGGLLEWITGHPDRGLELAEEMVALTRRIGHPFNSAFALTAGHEVLAECGELERFLEYCDEADAIIDAEGLGEFARNMMTNNWRGRALILQGKFESGYALTVRTNAFWKSVGGRVCSGLFWSSEALALHGMGRAEEALELIERAIDYCRETGDCWMEPELLRVRGGFLLDARVPQSAAAEASFTQALELARDHEAKGWELRAATSLARLWQSSDREPEARGLLTPVYEWFNEGFDTKDLRQAKQLLEQLG